MTILFSLIFIPFSLASLPRCLLVTKLLDQPTNQLIFLLNQHFFYLQNINSIGFELDVNDSTKVT